MKQALERVSHVLKTSNLAPHLSYVLVRDGWMSASDGRVYACAPVDSRMDFCVQGRELQRAIDFGDMEVQRTETGLLFKRGRSRITLKALPGDEFHVIEEPDAWRPIPEGYFTALRRASKFTSENATQAWAMGVIHMPGRLVTTNNVALASVDFEEAPLHGVVPRWLVDFLDRMGEEAIECWDTPTAIYLRFADGSWVCSKRIEGEPPEQLVPYVDALYQRRDKPWEIPAEWRGVYRRTLDFSKRDISVTPTCISAVSDTAEVSTDIETPVPHDTLWDHKFLGAVLEEATHWDIGACGTVDTPRHAYWVGEGIRGLICGKRRIGV